MSKDKRPNRYETGMSAGADEERYEMSDDGTTLEGAVKGAERWERWTRVREAARHGKAVR